MSANFTLVRPPERSEMQMVRAANSEMQIRHVEPGIALRETFESHSRDLASQEHSLAFLGVAGSPRRLPRPLPAEVPVGLTGEGRPGRWDVRSSCFPIYGANAHTDRNGAYSGPKSSLSDCIRSNATAAMDH